MSEAVWTENETTNLIYYFMKIFDKSVACTLKNVVASRVKK